MARTAISLALLILLVGGQAMAVENADPSTPPATGQTSLDELVVNGKKLHERLAEIYKTEDRFYALYNQLNANHDFDMHCAEEARTGTVLLQRVCRPEYIEKAEAEQARAFLTGNIAPPAVAVAEARRAEYRKNVLDTVKRNPQLLQLLRARYEMMRQYQDDRDVKFKAHWIVWE